MSVEPMELCASVSSNGNDTEVDSATTVFGIVELFIEISQYLDRFSKALLAGTSKRFHALAAQWLTNTHDMPVHYNWLAYAYFNGPRVYTPLVQWIGMRKHVQYRAAVVERAIKDARTDILATLQPFAGDEWMTLVKIAATERRPSVVDWLSVWAETDGSGVSDLIPVDFWQKMPTVIGPAHMGLMGRNVVAASPLRVIDTDNDMGSLATWSEKDFNRFIAYCCGMPMGAGRLEGLSSILQWNITLRKAELTVKIVDTIKSAFSIREFDDIIRNSVAYLLQHNNIVALTWFHALYNFRDVIGRWLCLTDHRVTLTINQLASKCQLATLQWLDDMNEKRAIHGNMDVLLSAFIHGSVSILDWWFAALSRDNADWVSALNFPRIGERAVYHNNIALVEWVVAHGLELNVTMLHLAAKMAHYDIVVWLLEHDCPYVYHSNAQCSVYSDVISIKILDALFNSGINIPTMYAHACIPIVQAGHLDVLQWYTNHGIRLPTNIGQMAVDSDRLVFLRWLDSDYDK